MSTNPKKGKKRKVGPLDKLFNKQRKLNEEKPQSNAISSVARTIKTKYCPWSSNQLLNEMKLFGNCNKPITSVAKKKPGRPRQVNESDTIFNGTIYANVGHALFNRIVLQETTEKDGKKVLVKTAVSDLTKSIFDLVKDNVSIQKIVKKANIYQAKKVRGLGTYTKWTADQKVSAVKELLSNIPTSAIKDEAKWRQYVNDTRNVLNLKDDMFTNLKNNNLIAWFKKYQEAASKLNKWDQSIVTKELFQDQRNYNTRTSKVPEELKIAIHDLIIELIANRVEINITILRPFVLELIKHEYKNGKFANLLLSDGEAAEGDTSSKFMVSRSWIRKVLKDSRLSYRKITNDAGKLPANWEKEKEKFYIRIAYLIAIHRIPRSRVLNMDETPIPWYSSTNHSWAPTNADNVSIHGAKDKRQATGTPWVTAEGKMVFFHTTIKGKTDRCLPNTTFMNNINTNNPYTKILFGYSENHWVSKQTMRAQVKEVEQYRKKLVEDENLVDEETKVLIIWDVYCRHRDDDLLQWMRQEYPQILLLFVPANLTELCQPLDIYFNARFKTILSRIAGENRVTEFRAWKESEEKEKERLGEAFKPTVFKLKTKLSETKELFYSTINSALKEIFSDDGHVAIARNAFKEMALCFEHDFQIEAVRKVEQDNDNVYFRQTHDVTIDRFKRASLNAMTTHQEQPTSIDDAGESKNDEDFIGRIVKDLDNRYPGKVTKVLKKRNKQRGDGGGDDDVMFEVKYYCHTFGKGRAKKVKKYSKDELLEVLVTSDEQQDGENNDVVDLEGEEHDTEENEDSSEEEN